MNKHMNTAETFFDFVTRWPKTVLLLSLLAIVEANDRHVSCSFEGNGVGH